MDEQKKPRAREKRVVEGTMKVEKQGEGLGTGPVGNAGGYEERREQEAARPQKTAGTGALGRAGATGAETGAEATGAGAGAAEPEAEVTSRASVARVTSSRKAVSSRSEPLAAVEI